LCEKSAQKGKTASFGVKKRSTPGRRSAIVWELRAPTGSPPHHPSASLQRLFPPKDPHLDSRSWARGFPNHGPFSFFQAFFGGPARSGLPPVRTGPRHARRSPAAGRARRTRLHRRAGLRRFHRGVSPPARRMLRQRMPALPLFAPPPPGSDHARPRRAASTGALSRRGSRFPDRWATVWHQTNCLFFPGGPP